MMKNKETEKEEGSEDIEEEPDEAEEPEEEQESVQFDDFGFFQQMASVDFTAPVLERAVSSPQQITDLEDTLSSLTTEGGKTAEDEFRYSPSSSEYQSETPETDTESGNIVLTPIETTPISNLRDGFREFRNIDLANQELQELMGKEDEEKYVHSEIIERDDRLPFQRGSRKEYREFKRR